MAYWSSGAYRLGRGGWERHRALNASGLHCLCALVELTTSVVKFLKVADEGTVLLRRGGRVQQHLVKFARDVLHEQRSTSDFRELSF